MRSIPFFKKLTVVALLSLTIPVFVSCSKTEATPTPVKQHWVKVYKDVILGDQDNSTYGQFLKSQTGESVLLNSAKSQAQYLSMMYFTGYNNGAYLTFPGNMASTGDLDLDTNPLLHDTQNGIDSWAQTDVNTGEILRASYGYINGSSQLDFMKPAEFNELITNPTWDKFAAKYKACNSGSLDLDFVNNYVFPANGDIYLVQLNNTVRAIVYVKSVVTSGNNGGSLKCDIIIEGSDENTGNSNAQNIQPSKD